MVTGPVAPYSDQCERRKSAMPDISTLPSEAGQILDMKARSRSFRPTSRRSAVD